MRVQRTASKHDPHANRALCLRLVAAELLTARQSTQHVGVPAQSGMSLSYAAEASTVQRGKGLAGSATSYPPNHLCVINVWCSWVVIPSLMCTSAIPSRIVVADCSVIPC